MGIVGSRRLGSTYCNVPYVFSDQEACNGLHLRSRVRCHGQSQRGLALLMAQLCVLPEAELDKGSPEYMDS